MARKPRVQFDGAFYHVIVRGNQRQRIFHDDQNCITYLHRLENHRQRYGFRLYAYVLMANHVAHRNQRTEKKLAGAILK